MSNGLLCRVDYIVYRNEDWRDDMINDAGQSMVLDSTTGLAYVWASGASAIMLLKVLATDLDSAAVLTLTTGASMLALPAGSISTRVPLTTMQAVPAGIYQHQIRLIENNIETVLFYGSVEVRP